MGLGGVSPYPLGGYEIPHYGVLRGPHNGPHIGGQDELIPGVSGSQDPRIPGSEGLHIPGSQDPGYEDLIMDLIMSSL